MGKIVKQFSIDVELDENDLLITDNIQRELNQYWETMHKNRRVVGVSWKAMWTEENYYAGKQPSVWD